jgi:hypothetical protein
LDRQDESEIGAGLRIELLGERPGGSVEAVRRPLTQNRAFQVPIKVPVNFARTADEVDECVCYRHPCGSSAVAPEGECDDDRDEDDGRGSSQGSGPS